MSIEPLQKISLRYMLYEGWKNVNHNVIVGISTRRGGVSKTPFTTLNLGLHVNDDQDDVLQNREKLGEDIGISLEDWVCADQVHDCKVQKVSCKDKGKGVYDYSTTISCTDGLYTKEKGVLLTGGFADCVPLLFYARDKEIVGIAHAGWKGTVGQIAINMIHTLVQEENVSLDEVFVFIGPSIGQCCYEVDENVIHKVDECCAKAKNTYHKVDNVISRYMLDLKKLNQEILLEAGIPEKNIEVTKYCTSCQNDLFFSHRKEKGQTGRMLAFIGIKGRNEEG
jgi:polyphenol oxidase